MPTAASRPWTSSRCNGMATLLFWQGNRPSFQTTASAKQRRCRGEALRAGLLARLEIRFGQFGLGFDGFAPADARFFFLTHRFAHMAQVEERFGELRLLCESLLVVASGLLHVIPLLRDQAGVIEQLRAALAQIEQALVKSESLIVILLSQ